MKKIGFLFLFVCLLSPAIAQQISLFDKNGEAICYIDYDEKATIYMWDGTPVAFIQKDRNDDCIFGFNGQFLGWYEDGKVYDKQGYIVGATKEKLNRIASMERIKSMKRIAPIRPITSMAPIRPMLRFSWSDTLLSAFILSGKK